MLSQTLRQHLESYDSPLQLIVACGVGTLLGVACLWLPLLWVLGALVGGALILVVVKRPEIALLGVITISSTIIPEESVPVISVGPGMLYITDVMLLALFGLIVVRWLGEPDFKIICTPLDWSLLAFYGMALLATLSKLLWSSLDFSLAIPEIRVLSYYLVFFIVTNLVREKRQISLLLRGVFFLGTVVAAAMIVQFLVGQAIHILPGRVEALDTEGAVYSDITRITNFGGESLILVVFITRATVFAMSKFRPSRIVEFLQLGLVGVGVVLTFNRNFWIGVGLALLLLVYFVEGEDRKRLFQWGMLGALLIVVILLLSSTMPASKVTRLASVTVERLSSLFGAEAYQSQESTFQWRGFEYKFALSHILSGPLLGLGLGARYRPFVLGIDHAGFDGRGYVHNAHIWILVKTGLLGYLCLSWLSLAFLVRGFKYWRWMPDPHFKGTMLGFSLVYIAVIIGSIVNPMFVQWFWTPVIGMMMGLNEAIIRRHVQEESASSSVTK